MPRTSFARLFVSGTVLLAALSVSLAALARPPYPGILKKVYPKANLSCGACHDGAPPKLLKYGMSVKGVLDKSKTPKVLTEAEIRGLNKKGIKPAGVK